MHNRATFWSELPDWSRVSLHAEGIDIAPVAVGSIWLVSGDIDTLLERRELNGVFGPRQRCDDDSYALRLAPDRLLFVSGQTTLAAFDPSLDGCVITDISDGMLIFDIGGDAAAELMAQGSGYLFTTSNGLPGESASMRFANFKLAASRRAQGWRLHIERPWAPALWRWLQAHVEQG